MMRDERLRRPLVPARRHSEQQSAALNRAATSGCRMIAPSRLVEALESRVLLAGSPTAVVGQGTFGGPPSLAPLHDFFIDSIVQVPGSSVEGSVINIAANATSATVMITGHVRQ